MSTAVEVDPSISSALRHMVMWTPAEECKLEAEYKDGRNLGEMMRAHGRSRSAIEARLYKLGFDLDAIPPESFFWADSTPRHPIWDPAANRVRIEALTKDKAKDKAEHPLCPDQLLLD